jgi:hypothetical protein
MALQWNFVVVLVSGSKYEHTQYMVGRYVVSFSIIFIECSATDTQLKKII